MKVSIAIGTLGTLALCSRQAAAKPTALSMTSDNADSSTLIHLGRRSDFGEGDSTPALTDDMTNRSDSSMDEDDYEELLQMEEEQQLDVAERKATELADLFENNFYSDPPGVVNSVREAYYGLFSDILKDEIAIHDQYFRKLMEDLNSLKAIGGSKDFIENECRINTTVFLDVLRYVAANDDDVVSFKYGSDDDGSDDEDNDEYHGPPAYNGIGDYRGKNPIAKFLHIIMAANLSMYSHSLLGPELHNGYKKAAIKAWNELNPSNPIPSPYM